MFGKKNIVKNDGRGIISRIFHFFFSWKKIVAPWKQIPKVIDWYVSSPVDKYWRWAALPVLMLYMTLLLALPLFIAYPSVWLGTYVYNYQSVIYPQPVVPNLSDKGMAITKTMISIGDGMLKNWQDNDLLISSSKTPIIGVDNPRNFQIGELMMYRRVLEEMREHLTRKTTNDYMDAPSVNAFNSFAYTSDKWIFVSTESMYRQGIDSQRELLANITNGTSHLYMTTYNIDRLLEKLASGLAGTSRTLEDADKAKFPWLDVDDHYYEAQGNMYVTLQILKSIRVDGEDVLKSKQAIAQLDDIIQYIEKSNTYLNDPYVVLNGKSGGPIPFHSGELAMLMQTVSRNIDKLRMQLTS